MPKFFSQNGEDCLLWELFKRKTSPGYYVEVGALDGLRLSNSYAFELQGWQGICIEAHPKYADLLRANRPNCVNVFAAAGDRDGLVIFYTNARGSLSTIDPSQETTWRQKFGAYFTGFEPVEVPMKTLTTIFKEAGAPREIDFISLDIEGAELVALQGLDFELYCPRVIVVEALGKDDEQRLSEFLAPHGYRVARSLSNNLIFCHDSKDRQVLARAVVDCEVTHLPHILDANQSPVQQHVVHIPRRPPSRLRQLSSAVRRFGRRVIRKVRREASRMQDGNHAEGDRVLSPIHDAGFHGDQYLLDFVASVVPMIDAFIETGTNVGSTARYMAMTYPTIPLYSCEPDDTAFNKAQETLQPYEQVHLYKMLSPEFLYRVHKDHPMLAESTNLYWLDAHQFDYQWPLADEIRFISENQAQAVIMIDDAEVPGQPQFQFAEYEGQACDLAYVTSALAPGRSYQLIHPNYKEHTSQHHPLVGVMIVAVGMSLSVSEHFTTRMLTKDVE